MGQAESVSDRSMTIERIDDEIAEFIRLKNEDAARFPDYSTSPLPRRREIAEDIRKRWTAGGPQMVRREDMGFDGPHGRVRLRLLSPRRPDAPLPAMVYVHGGGFTSFSIDTHDRVMREYAAGFGGIVIGIDYSLSPEVKFPGALEEVTAAIDWVRDRSEALAIDPTRLCIGGDSAGANLAMSACLTLRDRGEGGVMKAMLLNYGFFSADLTMPSNLRHGGEDAVLSNAELQMYIDNYLADTPHGQNPLAWPILADLRDLPPSFHAIAECDPLIDGDLAMVAKLEAAGNDVESVVYRGATHSFLEAVSISSLARQAFADQSTWLREKLARSVSAEAV